LVDLRGLVSSKDLDKDKLDFLFSLALHLKNTGKNKLLRGLKSDHSVGTVALIFQEPSTRTKTSFNEAIFALGGRAIDFNIKNSSLTKGESLEETVLNLNSLELDGIVLRSSQESLPSKLKALNDIDMWIVNAGDGKGEHPTQVVGDTFCLMNSIGLNGKKITIIGDVEHSRVAHSLINLWPSLGVDLSLLPTSNYESKLNSFKTLQEAQNHSDVLYVLRPQSERWDPGDSEILKSYSDITVKSLNENQYLMAPGPVMPGVDISSDLLKHERSLIFDQVNWGLYGRAAIIKYLSEGGHFG
tara:strand:- start:43438 stop:44337 length:900 start_codon:yes stop_codon:yes gene_type:complete